MFNLTDCIRLHSKIPAMGHSTTRKILTWARDNNTLLSDIFQQPTEWLQATFSLREASAAALHLSSGNEAQALADRVAQAGFRLVTQWDTDYPPALSRFDNSPPFFYLKGQSAILQTTGVAIGGARDVSAQGITFAQRFAQEAAQAGHTLISGAAKGVDITAHLAALQAGGNTALILPEGALKFAPRVDLRAALDQFAHHWAIISEFPPLLSWSVSNAMTRNQTVIALSQALCAVEAGKDGGTWEAGQLTLKMRLPLWVVDYPNPPDSAAGNAALIKQGAIPIQPDEPIRWADWTQRRTETPQQLTLL